MNGERKGNELKIKSGRMIKKEWKTRKTDEEGCRLVEKKSQNYRKRREREEKNRVIGEKKEF
jgi:hypothetical protein